MVTWKASRDGIPFLFNAEMRWRGAGGTRVLSPQFDYWDVCRVHVKFDVQWEDELLELNEQDHKIRPLVDIAACPFCNKRPKVRCGGGYIGCPPMKAEDFYITCCSFTAGFSRRVDGLDNLISSWNSKLGMSDDNQESQAAGKASQYCRIEQCKSNQKRLTARNNLV